MKPLFVVWVCVLFLSPTYKRDVTQNKTMGNERSLFLLSGTTSWSFFTTEGITPSSCNMGRTAFPSLYPFFAGNSQVCTSGGVGFQNHHSTKGGTVSVLSESQQLNEGVLKNLADRASFVVQAEVIEARNEITFWSGYLHTVEYVNYKVLHIYKGKILSDQIFVGHSVVKNSLTADPLKPRLSPNLFSKGNRLILFLEPHPEKGQFISHTSPKDTDTKYISPNQNYGAVLVTKEIVKFLEKIFPPI